MPEFRVINSLRDIEKQQWDVCFPGAVEDYNYLLAIEESALAGFLFRYLTAWNCLPKRRRNGSGISLAASKGHACATV